jgi:anaerobic magnesium-protoporphyrin IX monomethyl ester cyclase
MHVVLVFTALTDLDPHPTVATAVCTHPPLGVSYLSAYLRQQGHETTVVDLTRAPPGALFFTIAKCQPGLIGISAQSYTIAGALDLARQLKHTFPTIPIVMGGMASQFYLDRIIGSAVDAMVVGDGEYPLLQLVKHFESGTPSLSEIANIAFVREQHLIQTPRERCPLNLDQLPFPDRDQFDLESYARGTRQCYLLTSRGCPYRCAFCAVGQRRNNVRLRALPAVMEEVRFIKKHYPWYQYYRFQDDTLNLTRERILAFCDAVQPEQIVWFGNIRPDETVTDAVLQRCKESGAGMMEMGAESGNQDILDRIHKGTRLEHIEHLLAVTTRLEIPVMMPFMVPHYCDTPATVADTLRTVEKWMHRYLVLPELSPVYVVPGVGYWDKREEYGLVIDSNSKVLATHAVSAEQVTEVLARGAVLTQRAFLHNLAHLVPGHDFASNAK